MMNNKDVNNFGLAFLVVFLPFSLCFILSCLIRTMSSVLVSSLEQQIHTSTEQLGFLTAVYFLAQGLFQIPLGILLDKFGPKKVQVSLLLVATVGLLICTIANHVWEVIIANILIGVGMAGGLMSALKIIVQWFSTDKLPILNGLMMTFGGLGILLAATPTSMLADIFSWSEIHLFFALLTFLNALLILIIVPNSDNYVSLNNDSIKHQIQGVFDIYKSAFFWRIAPLIASILGSFMAFQSLWIHCWMTDVNHFNLKQVNQNLLVIGVAMTLSLLGSGFIYKFAVKYSVSLLNILIFFAIIFYIDEFLIVANIQIIVGFVWFFYGFLSHKFNLCFTIFSQHFPKSHSARANGALNVVIFGLTFTTQYLFGVVLSYWNLDDFDRYPVASYQTAFGFMILMQLVAFLWFYGSPFFLRYVRNLQPTEHKKSSGFDCT